MINGIKQYPAYKYSGVPWLGEVPEHWEVRRLGASVRACINGVWGSDPDGYYDLPCVRVADFDRYRRRVRMTRLTTRSIVPNDRVRRLLCPGDLLLEKSGGGDQQTVGMVVLYDHQVRAVCSNFIARMPVSEGYDSSYLNYLHAALYALKLNVRSIKQTTGIQNLDSKAYLSEPVAFPPLPEQITIVRFLDYFDRRIQRLILARQKRIKLLEEYKQALIHQAVTGQIDVRTGKPYQAYKDSGVEWLGKVPEHWGLKPLKRCVLINASVLPDTTPANYEFRYIDIGMVGTGFLTGEPHRLRFGNAPSRARRVLHVGDTIISTVRTYLKAIYYVDGDAEALVCSTGFAVLTPGSCTKPKYVSYLLQSNIFTDRVTAESVGTAYPAIAEGRFGSFHVPIPLLTEQSAIVEYLDAQTATLHAAIDADKKAIELLKEFRTTLIAEVVTGKLDVRDVAAQLPEEEAEMATEPVEEEILEAAEPEPAYNEKTDEEDEL